MSNKCDAFGFLSQCIFITNVENLLCHGFLPTVMLLSFYITSPALTLGMRPVPY